MMVVTKRSLTEREILIEELRWKKFPVLDDGHVCLVDVMGDDYAVVEAARVSYGAGTRSVSDDRTLIRYLLRHRHTTPFEMAEIKIRVRVPMDCWRQWIRHRTANVNEYSTRYSEAIDSAQKTEPDKWRIQSGSNKQGSDGYLPKDVGEHLSADEKWAQENVRNIYERRLKEGVAREQARKDLPLSTYTEAYWKIDLHNLLHFLGLRMDPHAQQEIRDYSTVIGEQIVKPLFPFVWEAFEDYRLGGLFLSRLDVLAVQLIGETLLSTQQDATEFLKREAANGNLPLEWVNNKCRERDECVSKLVRLGKIHE